MLQIQRIFGDEQGATSIEYSLIAGLIALAIIAGAQGVGQELVPVFNDVAAGLKR